MYNLGELLFRDAASVRSETCPAINGMCVEVVPEALKVRFCNSTHRRAQSISLPVPN